MVQLRCSSVAQSTSRKKEKGLTFARPLLLLLGYYQKRLEVSLQGCIDRFMLSHLLSPPLAFGQRPAILARSVNAVSSSNGSGSLTGRLCAVPKD